MPDRSRIHSLVCRRPPSPHGKDKDAEPAGLARRGARCGSDAAPAESGVCGPTAAEVTPSAAGGVRRGRFVKKALPNQGITSFCFKFCYILVWLGVFLVPPLPLCLSWSPGRIGLSSGSSRCREISGQSARQQISGVKIRR